MVKSFDYVIICITVLLLMIVIFQSVRFWKTKKYFGKQNAINKFFLDMKLHFLIPAKDSNRYQKIEKLLINTGWKLPVEKFYCLKYFMVVFVLVMGALVIHTNMNLEIKNILSDVNYHRSAGEKSIELSIENIEMENQNLTAVMSYLENMELTEVDPLAFQSVKAYLSSKDIAYDKPEIAAKRILEKINQIKTIESGGTKFPMLFIFAFLSFWVFNFLAYIKILLIYSKKDWEGINCLAVYSIISRLPPYKMDFLIDSMAAVCEIYKPTFIKFKENIMLHNQKEINHTLQTADDETVTEILETLTLADEIGIQNTTANIDEMLDTKLDYMEITATKRRQMKVVITLIPLVIVFCLLVKYLMMGIFLVVQNSMIFI